MSGGLPVVIADRSGENAFTSRVPSASLSRLRCGEPGFNPQHFSGHRVSCLLPDGQCEFTGGRIWQ